MPLLIILPASDSPTWSPSCASSGSKMQTVLPNDGPTLELEFGSLSSFGCDPTPCLSGFASLPAPDSVLQLSAFTTRPESCGPVMPTVPSLVMLVWLCSWPSEAS